MAESHKWGLINLCRSDLAIAFREERKLLNYCFSLESLDQKVGQQGRLPGLGQHCGDVPLWHLTNRDARHFFSRRDINDGH